MSQTEGTPKTCPKCGASYTCYSNTNKTCWCNNFQIKTENLKVLADKYNGCLCPDCLSIYAEKRK
ncbi:cysteine-rich CWC family protein [Carboxylicivirga sp. RSCT41]|uniref:cysteine-rich CWC family protein n=1 Tax=Carboxylicivirga agarovorans TaxID=3417570 RepID=UPI003D34F28A